MAAKVLFLCNDPTAPPALLGEAFADSGFEVSAFEVVPGRRVADPAAEVEFPDPLDYDVIAPLGSRWSVYDERLPWVAGEAAMLRAALAAGLGVLGVCFGGQLLAHALGGSVARSPAPEIGWRDVRTDNPALVPPGPWFQWHFDRLSIPPGAVEVAHNASATQAFVHGRALGLQFHPEVDAALVRRWVAEGGADLAGLGLCADDLRRQTGELADDAARRLRLLVAGFVGLLGEEALHRADRLG